VPNYLALAGSTLTLSAPDLTFNSHVGTHDILMHVTLTTYSITYAQKFQVEINNCIPTIAAPAAPVTLNYELKQIAE